MNPFQGPLLSNICYCCIQTVLSVRASFFAVCCQHWFLSSPFSWFFWFTMNPLSQVSSLGWLISLIFLLALHQVTHMKKPCTSQISLTKEIYVLNLNSKEILPQNSPWNEIYAVRPASTQLWNREHKIANIDWSPLWKKHKQQQKSKRRLVQTKQSLLPSEQSEQKLLHELKSPHNSSTRNIFS